MTLTPKKITTLLTVGALIMGLLHIVSFIPMSLGIRNVPINMLNLDAEQSISALFSTTLLWICAAFAALIALSDKGAISYRRKWSGIALIFFFLGIDETLCFHEKLNGIILRDSGIRSFGWTLPYAVIALLLGIIYLKFLFDLPKRTRLQIIGAGVLFISGAIGFELINGGFKTEECGTIYYILVAIEELLEMAGCIAFIHACSSYIAHFIPDFLIKISTGTRATSKL